MAEGPVHTQSDLEPYEGKPLFTDKAVQRAIQQIKRGKSGDLLGLTVEIFKTL